MREKREKERGQGEFDRPRRNEKKRTRMAMIRTMKGGKLNLQAKARIANETTIRMVTAHALGKGEEDDQFRAFLTVEAVEIKSSLDSVVSHPLENDSGSSDGVNDGGKSGLGKNDIGGSSSSVGSSLDGDSDVGSRESRGVVGSVSSHGAVGGNREEKVSKENEKEGEKKETRRTKDVQVPESS